MHPEIHTRTQTSFLFISVRVYVHTHVHTWVGYTETCVSAWVGGM